MAEHLIVVQAVEGSSPFVHPMYHQHHSPLVVAASCWRGKSLIGITTSANVAKTGVAVRADVDR